MADTKKSENLGCLVGLLRILMGAKKKDGGAVPASHSETVTPAQAQKPDYSKSYQAKYLLTKNEWYEYRKLRDFAEAEGLSEGQNAGSGGAPQRGWVHVAAG